MMRKLVCLAVALLVCLPLGSSRGDDGPANTAGPVTPGQAGAVAGLWHWALPDTPNGLHPLQSWLATGSAPNGDIYVAGMDHKSNAALYRIDAATDVLRYVGDARAASEAAGNWQPGETAQKFHTRPLWHRGKVYVATMDRSDLDAGYLERRGFHWYAYDPATGRFADLSAAEPGGSAVPHGNLVTLASDPVHNVIYGAGVPTGEIYRYDVASGRTQDLGRPSSYGTPYVYTGRVMWVDAAGRLYFTATEPDHPDNLAHVQYYDPQTGFGEEKGWTLKEGMALETGQCTEGGRRCVFADDRGHVYRFDQDARSWTYLGQVETGKKAGWGGVEFWLFALSPDHRNLYLATSTSPKTSTDTTLYDFDLATGQTRRLCILADLDPAFSGRHVHTGYDAWDRKGRFYFASFGYPEKAVIVSRIDPERLKAALTRRATQGSGTAAGK